MALAFYSDYARYALDWLLEEGRSLAPHAHSAAKQGVWGEPKSEEAAPGQMQPVSPTLLRVRLPNRGTNFCSRFTS